jgi:hypothetical protein
MPRGVSVPSPRARDDGPGPVPPAPPLRRAACAAAANSDPEADARELERECRREEGPVPGPPSHWDSRSCRAESPNDVIHSESCPHTTQADGYCWMMRELAQRSQCCKEPIEHPARKRVIFIKRTMNEIESVDIYSDEHKTHNTPEHRRKPAMSPAAAQTDERTGTAEPTKEPPVPVLLPLLPLLLQRSHCRPVPLSCAIPYSLAVASSRGAVTAFPLPQRRRRCVSVRVFCAFHAYA